MFYSRQLCRRVCISPTIRLLLQRALPNFCDSDSVKIIFNETPTPQPCHFDTRLLSSYHLSWRCRVTQTRLCQMVQAEVNTAIFSTSPPPSYTESLHIKSYRDEERSRPPPPTSRPQLPLPVVPSLMITSASTEHLLGLEDGDAPGKCKPGLPVTLGPKSSGDFDNEPPFDTRSEVTRLSRRRSRRHNRGSIRSASPGL